VQATVCSRKVSLGSFSEAQSIFDPELLRQVSLDLSSELLQFYLMGMMELEEFMELLALEKKGK
jgi:hypothetical protein